MAAANLGGRSIQVVSDLSLEEQLRLYERARRLKALSMPPADAPASLVTTSPALCELTEEELDEKNKCDPNSTVYLLFMEGSTRTRESIRNAAIFHGVKVNEFQAETSSFQKNETITDTMKMLSVYSTGRTVFVIRSPMEGVCSWLETALPAHTARFNLPKPAFVNAGDGRYCHPVSEFVDVFSLLENEGWNRSSIHVALVGDLAHGRTAHSKVEGLRVFDKVRVDLVAPDAFKYPIEFRNRMRASGFIVREFGSVREYLEHAKDSLATSWYFYQPKFKHCGEISQEEADALRTKVSFPKESSDELPANTRFFQTLPRDHVSPMVPQQLDETPVNGWDRVANNAYYVFVILLSMLLGKGDNDSAGWSSPTTGDIPISAIQRFPSSGSTSPFAPGFLNVPPFMQLVELTADAGAFKPRAREPSRAKGGGAVPLRDGLVVDHIGMSATAEEVWRRLRRVRLMLGWSMQIGSEGVYKSIKHGTFKGILSLPGFEYWAMTVPELKVLASISPGCTVNAIASSCVVGKYRLLLPERIYNLPIISCKNDLCVSNPKNKQRDVVSFFERVPFYETSALPHCKDGEFLFVCKYCKWPHQYADIWNEDSGRGSASRPAS